MNQITHWLDSSNVYGSGDSDAQSHRAFRGGRLRYQEGLDGAEMLENGSSNCKGTSKRCFRSGDKKCNNIIYCE